MRDWKHLLSLTIQGWKHHQQINVAICRRVSPSMGAKQDNFEGIKLLNDAIRHHLEPGNRGGWQGHRPAGIGNSGMIAPDQGISAMVFILPAQTPRIGSYPGDPRGLWLAI